jgi:hypothetical protein
MLVYISDLIVSELHFSPRFPLEANWLSKPSRRKFFVCRHTLSGFSTA